MQAKYLKVQSVKPDFFLITNTGGAFPTYFVEYFYPDMKTRHVITRNDKGNYRYFESLRCAKTVCSSINKAARIEVQ